MNGTTIALVGGGIALGVGLWWLMRNRRGVMPTQTEGSQNVYQAVNRFVERRGGFDAVDTHTQAALVGNALQYQLRTNPSRQFRDQAGRDLNILRTGGITQRPVVIGDMFADE